MKSLGNFPDPFLAEIRGQPSAARRAAEGLADQREALARLVEAAARSRTLVFTGMGSSYYACRPAVTLLAGSGTPAVHVDSAELLHFGMPLLRRDTLLVAVSQSGESAEVVRLANEAADLQGSPFILAVTNGGGSLSRSCDAWLDTRVGDETGPSTMTFTGSLVLLYLVALILADILALPQPRSADVDANLAGSLGAVHRDASGAADAAQSLLGRTSLIEELGEWLSDRRSFVLLGRGSSRAAAEMGALTIKEAAGFPAESLQTAQFRHGPLELAGPDLAAMVIATEPKTRDLDVGLAEDLAGFGAAVALVTEDPSHDIPGVFTIGIEPTATPLSPAVSVIPAQLLAWRLAIAGGREPGSFMRASKVTTRE